MRPPARYRVEHHVDGLSPLILGSYAQYVPTFAGMTIATHRLRTAGEIGSVVLINQDANPERGMAWRQIARRKQPGIE